MDYWFLIIAAILSFAGMVFHGFVGGRIYMGNINKIDMEPLTKSLSLVSWHVFTLFLAVASFTFLYIAHMPSAYLAAYPLIAVNLLVALLFIALGMSGHRQLLTLPGAYLMGATGLFAWLGIS